MKLIGSRPGHGDENASAMPAILRRSSASENLELLQRVRRRIVEAGEVLQGRVDGSIQRNSFCVTRLPATVMPGPFRPLVATVGADTDITPGTTRASAMAFLPLSGSSWMRV